MIPVICDHCGEVISGTQAFERALAKSRIQSTIVSGIAIITVLTALIVTHNQTIAATDKTHEIEQQQTNLVRDISHQQDKQTQLLQQLVNK